MIARKKRQLIMIISIIVPIIIVIGILVALYLTTDMFKPKYKLFEKYLGQNIQVIDEISKKEPSEIKQAVNNGKITQNLKATISYRDSNNNMANTLNNAEIDISGQADRSADYNYQNARLVYENSDIAKFEYLQDGNEYGIRLNGIQQFISAENSNLDELEANTGISKDNLKIIPILFNSLHLSDFVSFTPDEIQVITSTYSTLLEQNTEKSNYTKLGNQSVVVNGKTYKATSYTLKQSEEKLNNLIITLLERIEKDEIILGKLDTVQSKLEEYGINVGENSIRKIVTDTIEQKIEDIKNNNIGQDQTEITVYQNAGQTIKTIIKTPSKTLTFDTLNKELIQISYVQELDNTTQESNIKIERKVADNVQNVDIQYTKNIDDVEQKKFEVQINQNKNEDKIENDYEITYNVDGNEVDLKINQYITCVQSFENQVKLSEANNVNLDDLEPEKAKLIAEIAQRNVKNSIENVLDKIKLEDINNMLKDLLILKESEIKFEQKEEVVTEAERNRFNSQLTFFIGKEVDANNVNQLLNTIQDCFSDAQIFYEDVQGSSNKKFKGMILDIKRKSSNTEKTAEIKKILEENGNSKFTIAMSFDESTKLINKITIVSNEFIKK